MDLVIDQYFRCGFAGEDEDLFAVAIDVELAGTNHSRKGRVGLYLLPDGMVFTIRFEELALQVRAHICGGERHN